MLTYPSANQSSVTHRQKYPWALLILVFMWLWPGVFAHDLWKPAEPNIFAVIVENNHHFSWLPTLHTKAYFDVAPVYIQIANVFQSWFSPWLMSDFAASRLASVFFTLMGLLGTGMAGYRFLGLQLGRNVVLILIGSFGLLPMSHFLGAQSPIFAGVGLALWGYAVVARQVLFGSLLVGIGSMLLAQSAGLLAALAVLLSGTLTLIHPSNRHHRLFFAHLSVWVMTLPWLTLYPIALWLTEPHAFALYWQYHILGSFGGIYSFKIAFQLPYYLEHIIWFAFPALPLTLLTISRGGLIHTYMGQLSFAWLGLFGLFLALNPQDNQDLLILLLPVLALLGAAQLDHLRRGVAAFLNWFGIMTFGLATVFLWLGFVAMNYGFPTKLAERAVYFSPYYQRDTNIFSIIVALIFTLIWLRAITRKHVRARQAVANWAAGTTLVWALLMSLFLPWIDAIKSYRPIVQQMQNALPNHTSPQVNHCVLIQSRHHDAWLAWQQYARYPYHIDNPSCRYHLVQYQAQDTFKPNGYILWKGHRPRNKTERFALIDTQPK